MKFTSKQLFNGRVEYVKYFKTSCLRLRFDLLSRVCEFSDRAEQLLISYYVQLRDLTFILKNQNKHPYFLNVVLYSNVQTKVNTELAYPSKGCQNPVNSKSHKVGRHAIFEAPTAHITSHL